jgi:ATP-dependent DNA helicase RecG
MNRKELLKVVALGEDSSRQFKADVNNADSLAADLVAFSNSSGGTLFIGVTDDGVLKGLAPPDIRRINQLIGNAAAQHTRSPISPTTENIKVGSGRVVIALTVSEGLDKPYFDRNGVIWVKAGSDRRRIQSKEELRRLFQMTDQFHADELPTKAGIEALDKLRLRDYLRNAYKEDYPDSPADLTRLLQNLNLATDMGFLNLAGLLLFAEQPDRFMPQFTFKAIRFPGDSIHATEFLDSEDFAGPIRQLFDGAMAFVLRNLHKVQAGRGVNAPGVPEIPPVVFEELLVNALVHRDYLVSAPIRLFIFDNRIEIISPGHLPDNLTVDKIRAGNSNIRNPILVSHVAKGILPYRGLASGVQRALEAWPKIELADGREGCLFKATVLRTAIAGTSPISGESAEQTTSRPKSRLESRLESTLAARVLSLLADADQGKAGLASRLDHKTVSGELHKQVRRLLDWGLIEMTIPEKPKSRLQKYRLTDTGRSLIAEAAGGKFRG